MLSLIQATAILSLLMAFGVDTTTLDTIKDILIPPIENVSAIVVPVPTVITPIVEDAPVYFGNAIPTPTKAQAICLNCKKEVSTGFRMPSKVDGFLGEIYLNYTEDGSGVADVPITVSAPDSDFIVDGVRTHLTATQNSISGKSTATFRYIPLTPEDRDITVTAGGMTRIIRVWGNQQEW